MAIVTDAAGVTLLAAKFDDRPRLRQRHLASHGWRGSALGGLRGACRGLGIGNSRSVGRLRPILLVFWPILQGIDLRKQFCDFLRGPWVRHGHFTAPRHR